MAKPTKRDRDTSYGPVGPPEQKVADWVIEMHAYHERTGLYRTEDLNRVLGDPREQVRGKVKRDILTSNGSEED